MSSFRLESIAFMTVLATMLLAGFGVAAAQPTATIEPQQPRVYDAVDFTVRHNGSLREPISLPPTSGNLRSMGEIRRQSSFNSITGRSESITWQFDALEPGEFHVGPFDIIADGRTVTIPRITGTILPAVIEGSRLPPEVQDFAGNPNPLASGDRALARYLTGKAFVIVDTNDELWEGWPIRVSTYVYLSTSITTAEERSFSPGNAGGRQFVTIAELSTAHRNISQQPVRFGNETFRRYHVHTTTMVPTRAGRAEISSGELKTDFITIGRSRSRVLTSIVFEPSVREVEIRPAPPPLDGAHLQVVGNHSITSSLDRREIGEGELVTLTVRVSGNGYLELASLDQMPAIDGLIFIREEVASRINLTHRNEYAADKTFRRTYQAERGGTIEIPPIAMSNFNPMTGEQHLRLTEPLTLEVTAAEGATQILGVGPTSRPARADARELGRGGILHINKAPLDMSRLASRRSDSIFLNPWYWIGHGVILLGVVGFASFMAMRRYANRDEELTKAAMRRSRIAEAFRRAERCRTAEPSDAFYSALLDGVMSQIGRSLSREPGGLTIDEAVQELRKRGTPDRLVNDLEKLLNHCQSIRYTPTTETATRDEDLQRARSLTRELERSKP